MAFSASLPISIIIPKCFYLPPPCFQSGFGIRPQRSSSGRFFPQRLYTMFRETVTLLTRRCVKGCALSRVCLAMG